MALQNPCVPSCVRALVCPSVCVPERVCPSALVPVRWSRIPELGMRDRLFLRWLSWWQFLMKRKPWEVVKTADGCGQTLVKFTGIGLHNETGFLLGSMEFMGDLYWRSLLKISVEESGSKDD